MRAIHADPHAGNYLLNADGTIGLVDFGCVKYLKPEVVRCYGKFWSREWVHDEKIYGEIVRVTFGRQGMEKDARLRERMNDIKRFYDEFHPLEENAEPLDLGAPRFMEALMELAKVLVKDKLFSPDFLFLSRTESGMCNLLHSLKGRVHTTRIAKKYIPAMK